MRIVKDCDGDIWAEISPDNFKCVTRDLDTERLDSITDLYGPAEVYGISIPDTSLYRITYESGRVKLGGRRVLGAVLGYWRRLELCGPVKVERLSEPEWTDVTEEFI